MIGRIFYHLMDEVAYVYQVKRHASAGLGPGIYWECDRMVVSGRGVHCTSGYSYSERWLLELEGSKHA